MADNLAGLVRAAARSRPDSTALIFGAQRLSWAALDRRVDRMAAALCGLGLLAGDRVALSLGNTPDFVTAYFGILRAGLVALPLNTGYTAREVQHLLLDSGSRALIAAEAGALIAQGVRDLLPGLGHVVVAGGGRAPAGTRALDQLLASSETDPAPESGGGEDLAVLVYTSGTSGAPKGTMLSHRALLANLQQVSRIQPAPVRPDDVVLLVLPLFGIYGLNPGLGMVAYHGATGVLAERFEPRDTLALMAEHRVTTVVGAPPMYVAWSMLPELGGGFDNVRLAVSGSAPLPADALRRLYNLTGQQIYEGYGLTETAPVLSSTLMSEVPKPDSIGRPIPGVEVKLVDEDGDEVETDDHGELQVRGPNLFSGYWPDGKGGPGADGWWATGDIAYADDDTDLHLVDRRTELILVSGFNVYPREVEDVLLACPGVAEAVVIAIRHPHTGEAVKAVVMPDPGALLTEESVIAHCARSLARFKCPSTVEFVRGLPRSATGSVRRGQLRDGAAGNTEAAG